MHNIKYDVVVFALGYFLQQQRTMEEKLSSVINLLKQASEGDEQYLRCLNLTDGYDYNSPAPFNPDVPRQQVKDDLCEIAYFAAALDKLQLQHCEKVARTALSYALYVHDILFDKRAKVASSLNGQDVADDALEIVRDICATRDMLLDVNRQECAKQEEESTEGGSIQSGDDAKKESNDKKKSGEDADEEDEEEEDEESEGEDVKEKDEKDVKEEAQQLKTQYTSSHHRNRTCLVGKGCAGYVGPNLKRHLTNVHLRKNHISEEDLDRYFALGIDPRKKRGPPRKNKKGKTIKGRWKQCCPEPGCSYLGTYLPEHLQNKHHLKPSSATHRTSLKIARRFKSLADELEKMVELEPPISKISVPSPPPLPSKRAMSSDDDSDVAPSKPKKKTSKTLESDEDNSAIPSAPAKSTSKKAMSSSNDSDVAPSKPKEKKSKTLDSDSDDSENVIPPMPAKSPGSRISIAKAPSAGSSTPTAPYEQSADLEDDCDEPDYAMKEDYFKETEPNSNRHKWLIAYYKYLFTPSAGFHKERNQLQHASQVKTILAETTQKGMTSYSWQRKRATGSG